MKITIEHHDKTFNVALSNGDKGPFLVVKGCRVVDGQKGRFVSGPATKGQNGQFWNHTFMSRSFNDAVLEAYDKSKVSRPAPPRRQQEEDDEIPF